MRRDACFTAGMEGRENTKQEEKAAGGGGGRGAGTESATGAISV